MNKYKIFEGLILLVVVGLVVWIFYGAMTKASHYTPSGKIIDTFTCEGHKYIEFHYRGGEGSTIVHSQACPCLKDKP